MASWLVGGVSDGSEGGGRGDLLLFRGENKTPAMDVEEDASAGMSVFRRVDTDWDGAARTVPRGDGGVLG